MNHKHKEITYSLTRSRRKTMSIYVEPDGKVKVYAPRHISLDKINGVIDSKSYWIYKSISELQELNRSKVMRSISNGEGFLFFGRPYRLKIQKGLSAPLFLSDGFFKLDEKHVSKAKEHFIRFYREEGSKHISSRVKYFKKKFGIDLLQVRVFELKNRWASRGKSGINFHWKVMLAPIPVIDYIIVHELAHYIREGHGPRFWEVVESVMPNYQEKKNWLRLNGASLDI